MSQSRQFTVDAAIDRHLKERRHDVSESTLRNQRYALKRFREFCEDHEIEHIEQVDSFTLSDFRLERQENVSDSTVYNNLIALRVFIEWCEQRDLLPRGLGEAMTIPNREGVVSEVTLDANRAEEILTYLEQYEYATLNHALFAILWDTGIRAGTVRSLDLKDFRPDEQFIQTRHRPDTDTPLKNGVSAEREINLHSWASDVVENYIEARRNDLIDEHDRNPLLTTRVGRPRVNTIRQYTYRMTSPCYYDECPHDRDPSECEATQLDSGSKCPSSISTHPIRRGAITAWLNEGHQKELLSERMDVSVEILEKHYDARSESEKRKLRREAFEME
jgi:site-specific recombinase XerD